MRTYEEILESMKSEYRTLTESDPDNASDIGVRMAVLAGEIFSLQTEVMWLRNQMFPDTAVGEYLQLHAQSRGLSRKTGRKATGFITFRTEGFSEDIIIPAGTVCATSGGDSQRFVTNEQGVIPAGQLFCGVPAEALNPGIKGNVRSNTITVMVTAVAGISSLGNTSFSGGSDAESDEQLRSRIMDTYKNISNGTNKAFYIKTVMEVEGVTAVGVVPRKRGLGTIDVYITNAERNPSNSLIDEVKQKLNELREINVDIEVSALTLRPMDVSFTFTYKKGYDLAAVRQNCENAVREYFSSLSAGETVFISDMGQYILQAEGVKNYSVNSRVMSNFHVNEDCIAVLGSINIIGGVEE